MSCMVCVCVCVCYRVRTTRLISQGTQQTAVQASCSMHLRYVPYILRYGTVQTCSTCQCVRLRAWRHCIRRMDLGMYMCVCVCIQRATFWAGGECYRYCQLPYVTTNHFDVDSFLSVWCYTNRQLALQHEPGVCVNVCVCVCRHRCLHRGSAHISACL
jgi:hypothetical protein